MKLNGYFTVKQLKNKGLSYYKIKTLLENGILCKIQRGLYRNADMFYQDQSFLDVCKAIPKAVVTGYSALFYYGLSTHIPSKVFVSIPHHMRIHRIIYPPTVQYRKNETLFKNNIVKVKRDKYAFRIYDMEKVVCDTLRDRKTMGIDTVKEALREYLKRKDSNLPKLYKVAKKGNVFDSLDEFLTMMR